MLTTERKALILEVLRRDGRIVAKTFSRELGVSEDTIRRDLRELAGEGHLLRVHGGALPASAAIADFATREDAASAAKTMLGSIAARLIRPGQIVFLDGGTTNMQLARQLPLDLKATIVTHSPNIAVELARHPLIEVELIGGRLFKHSIVTVGSVAAEAISRIRTDAYFMGETGATTGDGEEAAIKRQIARQSADTIILATREKLGVASPYHVIPLAEITTLVTEPNLPQEMLRPFKSQSIDIVQL
jgi:DeoR/GlpR family transcriptional regulator of sugar metabolism